MKYLKIVRLTVSITVFCLFLWLFLALVPVNTKLANVLTYLQVTPAYIRWAAGIGSGLIGLLVVTGLTLLAGRVYCSSLCPLGTMQDVAIKLKSQKSKIKNKYKKPLNWLRFGIPLLALLAYHFGRKAEPLMVLDPYTEFGRITTEIIKPAAAFVVNAVSYALGQAGISAVRPVTMHFQDPGIVIISAVMLALLLGTAFFRGRLFCNTLCPVGGFLGALSYLSVFKLAMDGDKCNSCGLCGRLCKAECIDTQAKKLDFSKCVSCYNCVNICNRGAISYKTRFFRKKEVNTERRETIKAIFGTAAAAVIYLSFIPKAFAEGAASLIPVIKKNPVIVPPGAGSIQRFREMCTGCGLCVTACPSKVLTPQVHNKRGIIEQFQPAMDYQHSYCSFNCVICSQVCPTGAIKEITVEEKHIKAVGEAKYIKENCVVVTNGKPCVVCDEHCPTKAIMLVRYKNGLQIPYVREHLCIGCGACEKTCPAAPNKAIYVEGHQKHKTAEKPKSIGVKWEETRDFPF
ncbi:MAG: 4Fe-4S binding protein [Spirochaetia bacterium]|nr:4Fe-4S binding protein [Spirochaetia bacterium]